MKNKQAIWLASCTGLCMLASTATAQVTPIPITPDADIANYSGRDQGKGKPSMQFLSTKDLVGVNVKDSRGEKVGDITEIYLNPQNGVAFAAVDLSRRRHAVVPVQALKVKRAAVGGKIDEVTLGKSKSELESGPVIAGNEWQKLDEAAFTQQIFTQYNLQPPGAMGGAEPPGGTSAGHTKHQAPEPITPAPRR